MSRPGVSHAQLRRVCCASAGIAACYSAQINHGSATLLALGLDEQRVSLAWLAGPLSGLVMQPLVGVASDGCMSRFGRRRPFLVAGAASTAVALLLFSNARGIARALVGPASVPRVALAVAVGSFFLLDFSIQVVQAPLRALVTDIAPGNMLATGNMYVALFMGLGNLVGSLLASRRLSAALPFFENDTQALFAITAGLLVVSVVVCVAAVREEPLVRGDKREARAAPRGASSRGGTPFHALEGGGAGVDGGDGGDGGDGWKEDGDMGEAGLLALLRDAPRPFWRVFLVQLFTWFGFFSLFVFVNTWVGTNVYLGRGNAPEGSRLRALFEEGVRLGGMGNAVSAAVTVAYAPVLTTLLERWGIVWTYAFSQLVEAACLMSAHAIRGTPGQDAPSPALKLLAVANIGAFGIVQATTMGVPWSVIGKALNDDAAYRPRIGLFTTIFNVSQSLPQLFMSFGAPFVLRMFDNDVSSVMFVGGVFAAVGGLLVFALRVDVFANGKASGFGSAHSAPPDGRANEEEIAPLGPDVGEAALVYANGGGRAAESAS